MLTRRQIAEQLVMILRGTVLNGSERDIEYGELLGEEGIGLDSLGLVQFLTAVEKEFGTQVSIDVWSRAGQLTLDDCSETVFNALS